MFKRNTNEQEQQVINGLRAVRSMHKLNREVKKMGGEAPQITVLEYQAYEFFLRFGLYNQGVVLPNENNQPVEITRDQFFGLEEFSKLKSEDEKIHAAIVFLYSLKATHRGIWAENDRRIRNWWPKPLE